MNTEEEGNAYTCLDTHTQEFTRKRKRKVTRGSYKRVLRFVCMCGGKHKCIREEGGRCVYAQQ